MLTGRTGGWGRLAKTLGLAIQGQAKDGDPHRVATVCKTGYTSADGHWLMFVSAN